MDTNGKILVIGATGYEVQNGRKEVCIQNNNSAFPSRSR